MLYGENACSLFLSMESRIHWAFTTWTFGFYGVFKGNGNVAKVLHLRVAQIVCYVHVDERRGVETLDFPSMFSHQFYQLQTRLLTQEAAKEEGISRKQRRLNRLAVYNSHPLLLHTRIVSVKEHTPLFRLSSGEFGFMRLLLCH